MSTQICPKCMCHMVQKDYMSKWYKCIGCGYCHDKNGHNEENPAPKPNEGEADWDNQD